MPDIRSFSNRTLILLSNREPYEHRHGEMGIEVRQPAGRSRDRARSHDAGHPWSLGRVGLRLGRRARPRIDEGRVRVPPGEDCYTLRRVWLDDADSRTATTIGFANRSLWPLCHMLMQHFEFRTDYWELYQDRQRRSSRTPSPTKSSGPTQKPIVWIQDYHFALAAEMLARAGDARADPPILAHPLSARRHPAAASHRACTKRCLRGLLGNDLIEFHIERYALNFLGCVAEFVPEAEIDADTLAVALRWPRASTSAIFPISIDVERYEQLASAPESDGAGRAASQALREQRPATRARRRPRGLHEGNSRAAARAVRAVGAATRSCARRSLSSSSRRRRARSCRRIARSRRR